MMPSFSYPDYQDLARASTQLTAITGYEDLAVGIVVDREAERAWAQLVTSNLFDVLGVPVALGRGFTTDDEKPGASAAAVLSDAYWRRRFNGEPSVIGGRFASTRNRSRSSVSPPGLSRRHHRIEL